MEERQFVNGMPMAHYNLCKDVVKLMRLFVNNDLNLNIEHIYIVNKLQENKSSFGTSSSQSGNVFVFLENIWDTVSEDGNSFRLLVSQVVFTSLRESYIIYKTKLNERIMKANKKIPSQYVYTKNALNDLADNYVVDNLGEAMRSLSDLCAEDSEFKSIFDLIKIEWTI